jgi:hypothetical protein
VEGATAEHSLAWGRDRAAVVDVLCVVAIAVAAWRAPSVQPGAGADWNWIATLAYAAEHGLRFGGEIVWSYGPLGFLTAWRNPVLYYDDLLPWSWAYTVVIQLLLAGSLLLCLRRSLPRLAAVPLAAVVVVLAIDSPPALALAWCALLISRDRDVLGDRLARALPFALGALAGLTLLGKLNQGLEVVALAAVALAVERRLREILAFSGALVATAAIGWLATGQTAADVWPYLRYGAEIIGGYGGAMGQAGPYGWSYPAAFALIGLALACAWYGGRCGRLGRRRWGLLALAVVYAGFTFKEGFVRQDEGHLEAFFGDMAVLFAVLPLRRWWRPAAVGAIAASILAIGVLAGGGELRRMLDPVANARAAAEQIHALASSDRRAEIREELRREIAGGYGVTPAVLSAVGRRPVMMWPYLYGDVAWAYGLDFRPLPPLEPYATYTPALDRLGARMLESPAAPARIMRANATVLDDRHRTFEAPQTTLAIFCRYRQIAVREPWQVLARSRDRCGPPRRLGSATAAWGEPVLVPLPRDPRAIVLVRPSGINPQGLERLRALVLRPHARSISLDGRSHRLVAATATEGLLLSAPSALDYRPPFAMAPNPAQIAVGRDGQPGGRVRYAFEEIPVRPFRGAR